MQYLELPRSFPGLEGLKPGQKKELLVVVKGPDETAMDEGDDHVGYQIIKVDGVDLPESKSMEDEIDEADEAAGEDDKMEMQEGDNGLGQPTFTALMFGGKKKSKQEPKSE